MGNTPDMEGIGCKAAVLPVGGEQVSYGDFILLTEIEDPTDRGGHNLIACHWHPLMHIHMACHSTSASVTPE